MGALGSGVAESLKGELLEDDRVLLRYFELKDNQLDQPTGIAVALHGAMCRLAPHGVAFQSHSSPCHLCKLH